MFPRDRQHFYDREDDLLMRTSSNPKGPVAYSLLPVKMFDGNRPLMGSICDLRSTRQLRQQHRAIHATGKTV